MPCTQECSGPRFEPKCYIGKSAGGLLRKTFSLMKNKSSFVTLAALSFPGAHAAWNSCSHPVTWGEGHENSNKASALMCDLLATMSLVLLPLNFSWREQSMTLWFTLMIVGVSTTCSQKHSYWGITEWGLVAELALFHLVSSALYKPLVSVFCPFLPPWIS